MGLMRLGEGILNDGHSGGGIVSDADIPNLQEHEGGKAITLGWKGLFSNIFTEEALMHRATEKLIAFYMEKRKEESQTRYTRVLAPKRRLELVHFLRVDVQFRRRTIVRGHPNRRQHREEGEDPNPTLHRNHYYDLSDPVSAPNISSGPKWQIFRIALDETSVVYSMQGWRTFGVREIARLCGEEQKRKFDSDHEKWYIMRPTRLSPSVTMNWIDWHWCLDVRLGEEKEAKSCSRRDARRAAQGRSTPPKWIGIGNK